MTQPVADLRIVVDAWPHQRAGMRAASSIAREWPGRARVERATGTVPALAGRCLDGTVTLRVMAASWVRPSLALDFGASVHGDVGSALRLGLSAAAWEGADAWEPWYGLRATSQPRPVHGTPLPDARWVLLQQGGASDAADSYRDLERPQVHGLASGGEADADVEVRWKRNAATLAWVLGKVDLVVAPPGPLAYDALRCGVAVRRPVSAGKGAVPDGLGPHGRTQAVVHVLSPLMQRSRAIWPAIVERLLLVQAGADAIPPLLTPELVATARDGLARGGAGAPRWVDLVQRRARKLLRDPEAFLHDSSHAPLRALGRVVSAETSRCPPRHAGRWVRWVGLDES